MGARESFRQFCERRGIPDDADAEVFDLADRAWHGGVRWIGMDDAVQRAADRIALRHTHKLMGAPTTPAGSPHMTGSVCFMDADGIRLEIERTSDEMLIFREDDIFKTEVISIPLAVAAAFFAAGAALAGGDVNPGSAP